MCRASIPGCKTDVVSDTILDLLLNEAAKDIVSFTKCLPTNKKFSAVATQGDLASPYVISTVIGDYLMPDKGGLWWNQGTVAAPDYKQLYPRTIAWLDRNRPNWRDISDGSPEDYAIDGNNIIVVPAPVSSLSNAFWLFYIKTSTNMTATTHYPYTGSTTELTHLSIFDLALVKFVAWQVYPMINKTGDSNLSLQEYLKLRQEKTSLLKRRPDIGNSPDAALKGKI